MERVSEAEVRITVSIEIASVILIVSEVVTLRISLSNVTTSLILTVSET